MDNLEKAILISFEELGTTDSAFKSQAVAYCQQVKENPSISGICIELLSTSKLVQVQFWCLQCLHETIRVRYSSMGPEEKAFVRNAVFSMACFKSIDDKSPARFLESPAFIKNKLAQVFVMFIYLEYPLIWPSVFIDYLPHLSKGAVVIDMFCRILNSLDDELISLDYPRNADDMTLAAQVKDAMRQQCVAQIVRAWYDIVTMYRSSDPFLCVSVMDCMRRYISWIDIGLVANDAFIPLFFDLILNNELPEHLRGAAIGCVLAVVSKRMDPIVKLGLLQSLHISRVFGLVGGGGDVDAEELVAKVAALLIGYASEALDCSKRLNSEDAVGASELLNEALPSVFHIMQNCEIDITFSVVQFLSGYVATMKRLAPLREKHLFHISQILEVIRVQILYDPVYRDNLDIFDKIGIEEEDRMTEFRKDLFVLLRTVGRVAPDVTQIFIRNSLVSAVSSSSDRNVEEVEAALSLFYAYGESLSEEALRNGNGLLRELVPTLLSTRFPCHSNRLVALVYLETITRYLKFVQEHNEHIPIVLAAFLDERGIHHSNVHVNRRAAYLFMRVVKQLKTKLVPFIESILQSLQDVLSQFTSMDDGMPKNQLGYEDGSHIFEAIGLLIGVEDVSPDKQADFLSALLNPLCQQVEVLLQNAKLHDSEESPAKIANIQQIIMAINALSKGFSERLVTAHRPAIGLMFKKTLDVLLHILVVYPNIETLRSKVTSFIHRMVDTLGASVFPYLPKALEQLLVESEPKETTGLLLLLNQLICKFNTAVHDILEEVYPAIASRILNVLPRDVVPSGPGYNTEEIRELQELQRVFYTFLHVIATHDLSSVFLSPKCSRFLDPVMRILLYTACNHKDILVRKACVQIFIKLIKDWGAKPHCEDKVPGFQSFVIETFATNCCLYSVLDKSFEFRDANTLLLFREIVLVQKVMYEKFGNDFLIHFVSKGFPTAHCPLDLAEQYCQKLQGNDLKALNTFYQKLIESLRHQGNGSLIVR
ncbi:exportin-T-like [Impatiens glandulifera]|uniref:exportin-T-like n=1 Tax=Impatiens glandulifera TaxID=253017 RepID=UPI001FB158F9|nr:exportin-T-like [Impatiens glandulifera]